MTEPTVCAVMLTANRPEMARRAVECFRRQTYQNKRLYIYDSGRTASGVDALPGNFTSFGIAYHRTLPNARTIGELRNDALHYIQGDGNSEIAIHWDDDDYSHPNRITEQVDLLQSSGAEAVGYRDMLFWRTNDAPHALGEEPDTWTGDQAWLYTNHDPRYCLGTSLCYWRKTWESRPFEALPKTKGGTGEDTQWLRGVRSVGEASFEVDDDGKALTITPRMICSIHRANTQYYGADLLEQSASWKRVPEWDDDCRGVMNL